MARIGKIRIDNFRAIRHLNWCPKPGFNCLFGPGDHGKSSLLEAISWCLSGNRNRLATDADFFRMDVNQPIMISLTLIDLPDTLLAIEPYGPFHCGVNAATGEVEGEPGTHLKTGLTLTLTIDRTMQGLWSLDSNRVDDPDHRRRTAHRALTNISLLQMQDETASHLGFGRGSVLYRLTDVQLELSEALAAAARAARQQFSDAANLQLEETLTRVRQIAQIMGIEAAFEAGASLDAAQTTLRPSNITLQDRNQVPLTRLGLGSSRLLIAGFQHEAAEGADIGLVDEIESGLEPHRIVRLLQALGSKQSDPALQVFATTHSPVVVRELTAQQLIRIRTSAGEVQVPRLDASDQLAGTLRSFPEAFLAKSVLICEGASEVGLIRGLDLFRQEEQGEQSLTAKAVSLVNAGGCDEIVGRTRAFMELGYKVAILRDDDKQPDQEAEISLCQEGCLLAKWPPGYALEDALFHGLPGAAVEALITRATERYDVDTIEEQVTTHLHEGQRFDYGLIEVMGVDGHLRTACAAAAKSRKHPWFKQQGVGVLEEIGREVVGPYLDDSADWFRAEIDKLFDWVSADDDRD